MQFLVATFFFVLPLSELIQYNIPAMTLGLFLRMPSTLMTEEQKLLQSVLSKKEHTIDRNRHQ